MNGSNRNHQSGTTVLGVLLAIGLIAGGWILGTEIKATRLSDRYVTVKGLVERKVKSDLAIWPLSYKQVGDDLAVVYAKTESDKKAVLQFLDLQGRIRGRQSRTPPLHRRTANNCTHLKG